MDASLYDFLNSKIDYSGLPSQKDSDWLAIHGFDDHTTPADDLVAFNQLILTGENPEESNSFTDLLISSYQYMHLKNFEEYKNARITSLYPEIVDSEEFRLLEDAIAEKFFTTVRNFSTTPSVEDVDVSTNWYDEDSQNGFYSRVILHNHNATNLLLVSIETVQYETSSITHYSSVVLIYDRGTGDLLGFTFHDPKSHMTNPSPSTLSVDMYSRCAYLYEGTKPQKQMDKIHINYAIRHLNKVLYRVREKWQMKKTS